MNNWKRDLRIHSSFLIMILTNLFCYKERLSIRMNTWIAGKDLIKNLLPEREDFYSRLNIKDITDADYAHAKSVCKDFKIKTSGEWFVSYKWCVTSSRQSWKF